VKEDWRAVESDRELCGELSLFWRTWLGCCNFFFAAPANLAKQFRKVRLS